MEAPINKPVFYQPKKIVQTQMSLKQTFTIIFVVCAGVITFLVFAGIESVKWASNFTQNYSIRNRGFAYTIQMPKVWIEKKTPEKIYIPVVSTANPSVATNLTEEQKMEIIYKSGYGRILEGIRTLESSNNSQRDQTAHHVDCQKIGMSNEFGYAALDDFCFGSFEESVTVVSEYMEELLAKMSLNEALCYYNSGNRQDVCTYSKNYHALIDKDDNLAAK